MKTTLAIVAYLLISFSIAAGTVGGWEPLWRCEPMEGE